MQFQITDNKREDVLTRLTELGFSKTELLKLYDKIKISDSYTEEYVLRLMKMVAKDISSYCGTFVDEDNIMKEHALPMERSARFFFIRRRNGKHKSIIGTTDRRRNGKYKSIIGTSNVDEKAL